MRDLSFCARNLEAESIKLEAHDEQFIRVADLAQAGRFSEAADAVTQLIADNQYDVRLVGYALYAAFEEEGPAQLQPILEHAANFLTNNLVPLLPTGDAPEAADPRLGYFDRALTWLFRSIADSLEYRQAQKTEAWSAWLATLSRDEAAATAAATRAVSNLLPSPTFQSAGTQLVRILQLVRGLESAVAAPAVDAAARKGSGPPSSSAGPTRTSPPQEQPSPRGSSTQPTAAIIQDSGATTERDMTAYVRGSARFLELCAKLRAFEVLVKRGQFNKAAVVSNDIMHTIEHFDPRLFFPEVFATFGALLSEHIDHIGPRWDAKDSMEWRALEQYYQVDLDSFVRRDP